jgi:hypothetical protein
MTYSIKPFVINIALIALAGIASCKKESSLNSGTAAAIQAAVLQTQAVAVAASPTTKGDSIYVINTCSSHGHRDTLDFSSLPSAVTSYLNTNYSGFAPLKSFSIKDESGNITGYVAIIQFNSNPVGLKFDTAGNFVQVLEQREGTDLLGHGWHDGGCFQHRDGRQKDTVDLKLLPATILSYLDKIYGQDTLVKAYKSNDGSYVVLSKNNNLFASVFDSSGNFISRVQLPASEGHSDPIEQGSLPSNVLSWLSSTFPAYVFDKAFAVTVNGNIVGYCVLIDANNTKYGVQFDAGGNFIKLKIVR